MKKLSLLLLLFPAFVFAQSNAVKNYEISGTIANPSSELILVSTLRTISGTQRDTIELRDGGVFNHSISTSKRRKLGLSYGKEKLTLVIEGGKKSTVKFTAGELENSLAFGGDFNNENQFLVDYSKNAKSKNSLSAKETYSLDERKFISYIDKEKKSNSSFLSKLSTVLDPEFVNEKKGDIIAAWGTKILSYKNAHAYYVPKDSTKIESFKFKKYFRDVDFTQEDYLGSSSYMSFLSRLASSMAQDIISERESDMEGEEYEVETFNLVEEIFDNEVVTQQVRIKLLENSIRYGGITATSELQYEQLISTNDDPADLENISIIREKWLPLTKGNKAPMFSGITTKGKTKSLKDYRGQFVYLDVWATWCGPCKREIPSLKELEKKFSKENVVFISISIDSKEEPWQTMVKKEKLKGVQLYTEGAWNSALCKSYNVASIPRFMLIDPEGRIVDCNAPRPSAGASNLIESQLRKWTAK